MTAYAGYQSLADYLKRACARLSKPEQEYTLADLANALGWRKSYIYGVVAGRFQPSRDRLTAIADYFEDEPHLLYVLADLDPRPPDWSGDLRELYDIAKSLSRTTRRELIKYAQYLHQRDKK